MIQLGILGLPNSGKTTLFNAICGAERPIAPYPGGEIALHSAAVRVHDKRLHALQQIYKSRTRTSIIITFVDVSGMGTSGAEGLPGALRNPLAALDGFVYALRGFASANVSHPLSTVDPARDFALLEGEFLIADQLTVEKRLERIASEVSLKGPRRGEELAPERQLLERILPILEAGRPLRTIQFHERDARLLSGFGLLSIKPVLALLNLGEEELVTPEMPDIQTAGAQLAALPGALELELAQLAADERELFMAEYGLAELVAPQMLARSLSLLERITFFTAAENETRAWILRRGGTAHAAAAYIHSDLARGFIRAEVMAVEELLAAGSEAAMRAAGRLRLEGRDYVVQEGDILLIRFNV